MTKRKPKFSRELIRLECVAGTDRTIVQVLDRFNHLGKIERLDFLDDWIAMLEQMYEAELNANHNWSKACEADTFGWKPTKGLGRNG